MSKPLYITSFLKQIVAARGESIDKAVEAVTEGAPLFKKFDVNGFYAVVEYILNEEKDELLKGTTCGGAGCSECCYQQVLVTPEEASFILDLKPEVDREALLAQKTLKYNTDPAEFKKLPREHRKCVFLKEGVCSVYSRRPFACRLLFAADSPDLCNLEKYPEKEVRYIVSRDCLVAHNAWLYAKEITPSSIKPLHCFIPVSTIINK